ncbi:hypothetical protein [Chryseobacterium aquaticum]|uniref:hypothetical protein n=1 Tax=Chryseobacterium aquaticum TaxID=452084 RepID=UPI003F72C985
MKLETYTTPKVNFTINTVYWKLTKSDSFVPVIKFIGKIDSDKELELLKFYLNDEFHDDSYYRIVDFSNLQNNTSHHFRLGHIYEDRFIFIKGNFVIEEKNVFDGKLDAFNYCSELLKKTYHDGKVRVYDNKFHLPEFVKALDHVHFLLFETKLDEKNKLGYFKVTGKYPGPTADLDDDILEAKRLYASLNKFLKFSEVESIIIDITGFEYQYLDKYLEDFIPTYSDFDNSKKVIYIINENTDTTYGFVRNSKLFFNLDQAIEFLNKNIIE